MAARVWDPSVAWGDGEARYGDAFSFQVKDAASRHAAENQLQA